jgi:glycosyltransferase involved in cell wall biosynthesis
MKVGLVTGEFPPLEGGVGDFTRELALALAVRGVEVHIITRRASAGVQASAFRVHALVGRWSFGSLFQIRALTASLGLNFLNLQYQAAAYDLSAPIHFLPRLISWGRPARQTKTVITFHDLRIPYLFPKAGGLRPTAVTYLARTASGVIATDPADLAELRRRGVTKATQIPIGSNISPAPPAGYDRGAWRARWGVGAQEILLGYFGFLNASKGGDLLIESLACLVDGGLPVKLVLIGGRTGASDLTNAAFGDQLDERIAAGHLADRILRTGFVVPQEVSAHLLACDLLVLPYRDGVSFRRGSFMAALAHGCPIISTRPTEPLAELREAENICLVPPDSAEALTQAIRALIAQPQQRARLGDGARALSALFTWDRIAARTLEFYRSL